MELSIIIATTGRVAKIRRLLESLIRVNNRTAISHEIVIANNATDKKTAAAVIDLVSEFNGRDGIPCRQVREPIAGKCRAQNKTIPETQGKLVAFLDDDVEVVPEWLDAIHSFFAKFPHEVMQGSILMRPEDEKNEALQRALKKFRTVDFLNYGPDTGADLKTLTGGNMTVRREVFEQVGLFDERLGPGGYGISEDVEFAQRVIAAGKRIGWQPRAGVYNELDPSRLCEAEFRRRHVAQGRSRLAYKGSSYFSIIPNLIRSVWAFCWYSLFVNERKKYRAKGRFFHYCAMFQEKIRSSSATRSLITGFFSL